MDTPQGQAPYDPTPPTEQFLEGHKDCPFCGMDTLHLRGRHAGIQVICDSCGAEGPASRDDQAALIRWDSRVDRSPRGLGFDWFQQSEPAQAMFRKMGFGEYLSTAKSWRDLRRFIVDFNDCDQGHFVKMLCEASCSSGERVLLLAIATACDFAWVADYLDGPADTKVPFKQQIARRGQTWRRFDRVSGDYLRAVAACILMMDDAP